MGNETRLRASLKEAARDRLDLYYSRSDFYSFCTATRAKALLLQKVGEGLYGVYASRRSSAAATTFLLLSDGVIGSGESMPGTANPTYLKGNILCGCVN